MSYAKLPNKKYNIIYADPPWKYADSRDYAIKNNPTGAGGAVKHYPVMTLEEIKNIPVIDIVNKKSCFLFLWCTGPKMDWGIEVLKSWGFRYVTIPFVWIKTKNNSNDIRYDGIGCYTNNNAEYCLLGRIGKYQRANTGVRQILLHRKLKHSQKPDEIRNRIIRLIGDLPRIELFARNKFHKWDFWGNGIKNT